jgi:CRP-like cAMP-binding protein
MIIKPGDFLRGLSRDFVMKMTGISVRESYKEGDILFHEKDGAKHFYILIKGRVRLSIGKVGCVVHTVSDLGEAFGWSSLLGRDVYSASAECMVPTELYKIGRDEFQELVAEDPGNGLIFFKSLAGTIGKRLNNNYKTILLGQSSDARSAPETLRTLEPMNSESTEGA